MSQFLYDINSNTYPLLRCLYQLSKCTLSIPRVRASEAPISYTREERPGCKQIRVGAHKNASHHSTRRRAGGKDTRRVDSQVGDSVTYDGSDAEGVTASIVRERRGRGNVPTATGSRSVRVNDDESMSVGKTG